MFDVLVIGSGLAGTTAALAARKAGAKVAVASRSWGATATSTGALDLAFTPALSAVHQTPRTIAEHVMDIIAHRKSHPYGVVGLEATVAGMRRGYDLLREILADSDLELAALDLQEDNTGLPSVLGSVVPAGRAYGPHCGVDFSRPLAGRWGLLQLHGDSNFDARRLSLGLARDGEALAGSKPELVEVPISTLAKSPMAMARAFDDYALVDEVAKELESKGKDLAGLITPPVLGLDRSAAARERLSEAIGGPVVEALAQLPSVPGLRLQRQLDKALARFEVSMVGAALEPKTAGNHVEGIVTADKLDVHAGAVVLASGRFIAGGIAWTERCRESLFDLPLVTEIGPLEDDSPLPVVRDLPTESHPLMTAGVGVGRDLRPTRDGRVAFQNLFAAGNVIGGFASRYALCSDGVALATGWMAGQAAAAAGGAS